MFPLTTLGSFIRLVPSNLVSSLYLGLTAATLGFAEKSNWVVVCFINIIKNGNHGLAIQLIEANIQLMRQHAAIYESE